MEERITRKSRVFVGVPCLNDAKFLGGVLERLVSLKKAGMVNGILVVNDCSKDNSAEIAGRFAGDVELFSFPENRGKSAAFEQIAFWAKSRGADILGTFDADLKSISADQFNRMLQELGKSGVKMVVGTAISRVGGEPIELDRVSGQRLIRMSALKPFFAGNNHWTRMICGRWREKEGGRIIEKRERGGYGLEEALNRLMPGKISFVKTGFLAADASLGRVPLSATYRASEHGRISRLDTERKEKLEQARARRQARRKP